MINSFNNEYGFLSNFWTSQITMRNRTYATVEHYFQAMKARTTKDHDNIRLQQTPGMAKHAGRTVEIREDWDNVKIAIMHEALEAKFNIPILRQMLINTQHRTIVEGNKWHDNYWGDCYCERCKDIKGTNVLGLLLMTIRSKLILEHERYKLRNRR